MDSRSLQLHQRLVDIEGYVVLHIFGNGREQMRQQADTEKDELYKQIGQLKVELDFLKKRAGLID
jgi:hypothetical protein